MHEYIIIALAGIGLLTIFCQWLAWWVKLPAIVFLLIAGLCIGPGLHWLQPPLVFGHLLEPIITLAVAIILFEGSLTLKLHEIQKLKEIVQNLVTTGLLLTWVATTLLVHWLFHFSWDISALLGAITVVSGPTVVTPILRTVRPNKKISQILRWESIVIDPLGALLAVLVFSFITATYGVSGIPHILLRFGETIVISLTVGVVAGHWLGVAIARHWIPEFLHNIATLSVLIIVFTATNMSHEGCGLLTVTVMGIWLSNMPDVEIKDILHFKESLSILLISGLFIILAAQVSFLHMHSVIWETVILLLVLQFVIRPLGVFFSTLGSDLSWQERALIAWISPRGIVSAATAALFGIQLNALGFHVADQLVLITFLVVIGTVLFQGITARFVARWLGVAEPEPRGFLIIGSNPVARTIANALKEHDYRVLVSGMDWDSICRARLEGLDIYYGNPVSQHADRHLNLVGIGGLLALSPQHDLNTLASLRYKAEFGRDAIYALKTNGGSKQRFSADQYDMSAHHKAHTLFGKDITYAKLASLIGRGAQIRSTPMKSAFNLASYHQQYGQQAVPLFAIDPKKRLHIFTDADNSRLTPEWTIMSLVPTQL